MNGTFELASHEYSPRGFDDDAGGLECSHDDRAIENCREG